MLDLAVVQVEHKDGRSRFEGHVAVKGGIAFLADFEMLIVPARMIFMAGYRSVLQYQIVFP